jgi:hypothetical protein
VTGGAGRQGWALVSPASPHIAVADRVWGTRSVLARRPQSAVEADERAPFRLGDGVANSLGCADQEQMSNEGGAVICGPTQLATARQSTPQRWCPRATVATQMCQARARWHTDVENRFHVPRVALRIDQQRVPGLNIVNRSDTDSETLTPPTGGVSKRGSRPKGSNTGQVCQSISDRS